MDSDVDIAPRYREATGSSTIEVIISVAVVVVGLLGMASLHFDRGVTTIAATQEARAHQLANEIANRIRLNSPQAVEFYLGHGDHGDICGNAPSTYCGAGAEMEEMMCSSQQQASFDVWDVLCNSDHGPLPPTVHAPLPLAFSIDCADNDLTDRSACSDGSLIDISVRIGHAIAGGYADGHGAQIVMSL